MLNELCKTVKTTFESDPSPLEQIDAKLQGVTDEKDVPYEIALEIHQAWRQITIAVEIAQKYDSYRLRINSSQLPNIPVPDLPPTPVAWFKRVYHACNQYQFFRWYEATMAMVSMSGFGVGTVDLGLQDANYGMIQVARQAFLNNDTVQFMMKPRDMFSFR